MGYEVLEEEDALRPDDTGSDSGKTDGSTADESTVDGVSVDSDPTALPTAPTTTVTPYSEGSVAPASYDTAVVPGTDPGGSGVVPVSGGDTQTWTPWADLPHYAADGTGPLTAAEIAALEATGAGWWSATIGGDGGDRMVWTPYTAEEMFAIDGPGLVEDAMNAANDENLIPYSANMDAAHGWTRSNATLNGDDSGVIASYTGSLDWSHRIASPEMALSDIWDREATFSVDGSATGGSATLRLELDVYREGSASRFAYIGLADLTATTSAQRISHTFTAGSSTGWSFTSQDDKEFKGTDRVRAILYSRTLSRTVTLAKWQLQSGGEATPWRPAKSDASSLMAEKVATNYVTEVSSAGIKVHPSGSTTDYALIDADGLEVFDGGTSVAQFGATARVGQASKQRVAVTASTVSIYDTNNALAVKTNTSGVTLYRGGSRRAELTAAGLDIYGSDGSTSISSFGSTVRVGKASDMHVNVSSSGFSVVDKNSKTAVDIVAGSKYSVYNDRVEGTMSLGSATNTIHGMQETVSSVVHDSIQITSGASGGNTKGNVTLSTYGTDGVMSSYISLGGNVQIALGGNSVNLESSSVLISRPAYWRKALKVGAATVSLAADAATKTSNTKVALSGIVRTDSSLFSQSSNGIKCLVAGTVKISAQLSINGNSYNGGAALIVTKNAAPSTSGATIAETIGNVSTASSTASVSMAPKCVTVAANDVFYMYARTTVTTTATAASTYLTVEYIA